MSEISLSFPDQTYTDANKPSTNTLKADLGSIELAHNAHEADTTIHPTDVTALVTKTGAETLTNKTLTSPVINTPTGIVKGDVGLGNVDNTSDATKNSATATLTNKRVNPRTSTVASSATPTINTDTTDIFTITALAADITSMTSSLSGTPVNGQKLIIRILDNGTARAITWGASFASRGATLPTTTVLSKYLYIGLIYNSTAAVWDCVAFSQEV